MRKLGVVAAAAALWLNLAMCQPTRAQNTKRTLEGPSQSYAPTLGKTLLEVCPNAAGQFPKLPNNPRRPSFTSYWQTDYPTLVFDAKTGNLYWLEPPTKTAGSILYGLQPITFTPITFVNEKILVLVCNEHFGATTTITPTNTVVNDSSASDIDLGSYTTAVAEQSAAASGQMTALMNLNGVKNSVIKKQIEKLQTAPQCQALPGAQAKLESAIDALTAATDAMKVSLQDGNLSYPTLVDPQKFISMIPCKLKTEKDDHSNSRLYNDRLRTVTIVSQSASPIIASFNTLLDGKPRQDFKAAAKTMKQAVDDYTKQLREATNQKLLCSTIPDAVQQKLAAATSDYNTVNDYIETTKANLRLVSSALAEANSNLIQWNLNSSIDSLSTLDSVNQNTLTRLTFQIADAANSVPAPATKPTDSTANTKTTDASTKGAQAQPAVNVAVTSDKANPAARLLRPLQQIRTP